MNDIDRKDQRRQDRGAPWTEEEIRKLLEPARQPFVTVVKRDQLPLVWTREVDYAIQIIRKDGRFRQCEPHTIISAVKNLAFIGLSLNPARQHATILARYIKWPKPEHYEAGVMVMYRGLAHLATEAGCHGLKVELVYKGDHWEYGSSSAKGGDWYEYQLSRTASRDFEKDLEGVFVAATMPAGDLKVEWIPAKDIYRAREQSESYLDSDGNVSRYSPWNPKNWAGEMAKKVGLKRASKRWEEMIGNTEQWERFLNAIRLDNEADNRLGPRPDDIEGEATEKKEVLLLTHEQTSAIRAQLPTRDFEQKICAAYGAESLEKIPAERYEEIGQRIAAAKKEQERRAASQQKGSRK